MAVDVESFYREKQEVLDRDDLELKKKDKNFSTWRLVIFLLEPYSFIMFCIVKSYLFIWVLFLA